MFLLPRLVRSGNLVQKMEQAGVRAVSTSGTSKINVVTSDKERKALQVQWEDGTKGVFPFVWLRDSAPVSRPQYLNELSLSVCPDSVEVDSDRGTVHVQWPPYCHVEYDSDWLKLQLPSSKPAKPEDYDSIQPELWDHDQFSLLSGTVDQLNACTKKVTQFRKTGVALIHQSDETSYEDLLKMLLGRDPVWTGAAASAGTNSARALHTSFAEYDEVPTYVCLSFQPEGDSASLQIVDGWKIAGDMQTSQPEYFNVLWETKLSYRSNEYADPAHHPVFSMDHSGHKLLVFDNIKRLVPYMSSQPTENFYRALKFFYKSAYRRQNVVNINMRKGDTLILRNGRILYGHSAIDGKVNGKGFK